MAKSKQVKLRIALDIRSLLNQQSGIGHYTENLIEALHAMEIAAEIFLLSNIKNKNEAQKIQQIKQKFSKFQTQGLRCPNYSIFLQGYLPFFLKKNCLSLYHNPNYLAPLMLSRMNIKVVITVHDLSSLTLPQFHKPRQVFLHRILIPTSMKIADAIITDSVAIKEEIANSFSQYREKIYAVPLGGSEVFKNKNLPEDFKVVQNKYQLPDKYILFVGSLEPRKNILTLLEAVNLINQRDLSIMLIMVGGKGWKSDNLREKISNLEERKMLKNLGYIPENELALLFQNAELFVYPSWYEGFGLPVLQAMTAGTPIVCSDIKTLKEITYEAAKLVDPSSVKRLADAIEEVLKDKELQNKMRQAGLKRAQEFTWQKTAQATFQIYQQVLSINNSFKK